MNFTPYLTFNGDCKEAFEFYAEVFDATIDVMRFVRDESFSATMPEKMHNLVMYARLSVGDAVLMASDNLRGEYQAPKGIHISAGFEGKEEAARIFDSLSEKGEISAPLSKTFF